MNEPSVERKIYDLLDNKLAEFHYDGIQDEEFFEKWDRYLVKIGADWRPSSKNIPSDIGGLIIGDPLYTRGGVIRLSDDLVQKILFFGLP